MLAVGRVLLLQPMLFNISTGLCCWALDRLLALFSRGLPPGPGQGPAEQHWAPSAALDRSRGCSSTLPYVAAQSLAARRLTLLHSELCELPAGERTPNWPDSTGVLLGLRPGHLRAGLLYRAAMEGATFSLLAGRAAQTLMVPKAQLLNGHCKICSSPCARKSALDACAYGAWL